MATLLLVPHFHAYAYTGKGFSDSEIRSGIASPGYPPILFNAPRSNSGLRLGNLGEVMAWLEKELFSQQPLDAEAFPVSVRLAYSRARLQQARGGEVVYGYWTSSGRYASRRVFPCRATDPGCDP